MRERDTDATEKPIAAVSPLHNRQIWRVSFGSSLLIIVQMALTGFLVLYLHNARQVSAGFAALMLAAISVCGAALRIIVGRWSDRVGSRLMPLRLVTLAILLSLAAIAATARAPVALVILALVVGGTLSVLWNGLSYVAVAEIAGPARAGSAIGLQQTLLGMMGALTPLVFAAAVSATSWNTAFLLLLVLPIGAYPFFRDTESRMDENPALASSGSL